MKYHTKRTLLCAGTCLALTATLGACGAGGSQSASDGKSTLNLAFFDGGNGPEPYQEVVAAYKELFPDVEVNLVTSTEIEDEIMPGMKAGRYPDLVQRGLNAKAGLVETMLGDNAIADVTDVLSMQIPGEEVTVGEKLIDGIIGPYTNPNGDDRTFLLPTFYSPAGLVYNKTLLEENGWEAPQTWDEMFELGKKSKEKGISVFTYATSGYFDSLVGALLADAGGEQLFQDVMFYKKDVWKSDEARKVLDTIGKIVSPDYLHPDTLGYANVQDSKKNQQTVLNGDAVFMPNGTWIRNEMKDAPKTENFKWALSPAPGFTPDERYLTVLMDALWTPTQAKNPEEAKRFMAFMYSDKAAEIFAKIGQAQPIKGITDKLEPELAELYGAFDQEGVKIIPGTSFSQNASVEGVSIKDDLYSTIDSIASGKKTVDEWQKKLNDDSNALNEAMPKDQK